MSSFCSLVFSVAVEVGSKVAVGVDVSVEVGVEVWVAVDAGVLLGVEVGVHTVPVVYAACTM